MISFRFQSFQTACLSVDVSLSDLRGITMTNGDGTSSPIDPLSVAFVSPAWPPETFANGVIPYIDKIARELRSQGHSATILSPLIEGPVDVDLIRDVHPRKVTPNFVSKTIDRLVYRVSTQRGLRRESVRSLVQECRRLIDDRGLQLLEMEDAYGMAHWVRRRLSIPVVVRLHGPWFLNGPFHGSTDSPAFRERVEAEGQGIASADLITSPSFDVLERTREYYGLELPGAVVFPPPTEMVADEDLWNLENSDRDQVLFIGRFDRHKGGDLLIDAFAEVARRRPNAKLRFVGPDRGLALENGGRVGIEEYIREKAPEAAGRIERLGQVPSGELNRLRRQARVTVVCSRYETFGLTLTEAVTTGCPTVATRVGAFVEIVQDGVNGLLCASENPAELADRIVALLDDDELAARLGQQAAIDGRNRYEAGHLALQASKYYARLLKSRNRMGRGVAPR